MIFSEKIEKEEIRKEGRKEGRHGGVCKGGRDE